MLLTTLFLAPAIAPQHASATAPSFTFVDATRDAGIVFQQRPTTRECQIFSGARCEMEFLSGGVAVADFDGDGRPDIHMTRLDGPDALFWNRGDGTFVDVAARVGLAEDLQTNGAVFGDVDNDGDQDLFVTVFGAVGDGANSHHRLYINDGAGRFREEAVARGVGLVTASQINGFSATFGDFDLDGWIDLSVTQWFPDVGAQGRLFRNRGAAAPGHFEDVTQSSGVEVPAVWGFANTLVDLDDDGLQELAVVGDFGTSRLFWNQGGSAFVDGTRRSGVGTDENGMGSTFGDIDGDGDLDWFVSSVFDPFNICADGSCGWGGSGNRLFRNEGGRLFSDATDQAGVRDGGWGWGAAFLDADNDADLDLIQANGVQLPTSQASPFFRETSRFWINDGQGGMTEAAALHGITDTGSGKGLATLDYDLDGDLDVLIAQNSDGPLLLRNDGGNASGWLRVKVEGTLTNRDGLGAVVRVWRAGGGVPQIRHIGVGTHFLGQSESVAHFGLGDHMGAVDRVEVHFPVSGVTRVLRDVAPGSTVLVTE